MESSLPSPSRSRAASIRVTSGGHAALAVTMIVLGVMGLVTRDFAQIWQPVPQSVPAREALVYLCAVISLACGLGLLLERYAVVAARVLVGALMIWLLTLRVPFLFYQKPLVLVAWSFGSTAVMAGAALVLYIRLAGAGERWLPFARALYGVSLIPFGLAHFMYLDATTVLIPRLLPWPAGWAYLTGAAFIAAGLAAIFDVFARLAVWLSVLQLVMFGFIVWVPRVVTGNLTQFQRGEVIANFALTAGAWVVAESYRGRRWLAPLKP
jgi:uncharacterized membrane protein